MTSGDMSRSPHSEYFVTAWVSIITHLAISAVREDLPELCLRRENQISGISKQRTLVARVYRFPYHEHKCFFLYFSISFVYSNSFCAFQASLTHFVESPSLFLVIADGRLSMFFVFMQHKQSKRPASCRRASYTTKATNRVVCKRRE